MRHKDLSRIPRSLQRNIGHLEPEEDEAPKGRKVLKSWLDPVLLVMEGQIIL